MNTRANNSKERILSVAETLILKQGFAGTSIEDVQQHASISKGGFFYHFRGKTDLAKSLVERYLDADEEIFSDLFKRADELSEDSLQRLFIFLKLLAEMMSELESTHPGCLAAAFSYQSQQLNDEVHALIRQGILNWREMIAERLQQVLAERKPKVEISVNSLADMFTSSIEGGIILSLVLGNNKALVEQILNYRTHLHLLFDS